MMSGTMVIDATGASVKRQNVSAAGYVGEPVTAGTK